MAVAFYPLGFSPRKSTPNLLHSGTLTDSRGPEVDEKLTRRAGDVSDAITRARTRGTGTREGRASRHDAEQRDRCDAYSITLAKFDLLLDWLQGQAAEQRGRPNHPRGGRRLGGTARSATVAPPKSTTIVRVIIDWVGRDLRLVLEERGQVARRERRHRARFRVGLELEQRAEVRLDPLAERELGHHEDAARNSGTGSATPPSVRWVRAPRTGRKRAREAPRTSPSSTPYRARLQREHRRQTSEWLLPMRATTSQACSPFEVTGPRICAHVAPVLCQDLLADALSAAESSKTDVKVVVVSAIPLIPCLSRTTSKIEG